MILLYARTYTILMSENGYREEIARIDAECAEIRKQIMQLEFQNKKDITAAESRATAREEERRVWDDMMTKKITHIAQLAGITYEELDMMEDKLIRAGSELARPREHSVPS